MIWNYPFPANARSARWKAALILCWCAGLLAGCLLAGSADTEVLSMMRAAFERRVSIVSLLIFAFLPFLITAYAVLCNHLIVFSLTGFAVSTAWCMCASLIFRAFGSAGWLVQPLAQFTQCCAVVLYFRFCLCVSDSAARLRKELILCAAVLLAAVIVDGFLVSRFLAALMIMR